MPSSSVEKVREAKLEAPLPFIDLAAQRDRIRPALDAAIRKVLDHSHYIMGPEVEVLEKNLTTFCGAKHAISCSSGTDALLMVLMAKGIGPGDAVLCPAFTFTATPEVVALLGATPVFSEVLEDTFNVDVNSLPAALDAARKAGLKPKALIAVDLFGQPADYDAIEAFAASHDLWVLADAAQAYGATYKGRKVGTMGLSTATSFFPAKPLGCYGDGGAIFTNDEVMAVVLDSIRVHGKGEDKYDNIRVGINGRLDTIQAAILIEKLKIFADEIDARDHVARSYADALAGIHGIAVPVVPEGYRPVWAQYTLRVPAAKRDAMAQRLKRSGIPTAVYYPRALHHQTAYRSYPVPATGLAVSERLATEVLSLPMHPYMSEADIARVAKAVAASVGG